jgi:hypothetical protein
LDDGEQSDGSIALDVRWPSLCADDLSLVLSRPAAVTVCGGEVAFEVNVPSGRVPQPWETPTLVIRTLSGALHSVPVKLVDTKDR